MKTVFFSNVAYDLHHYHRSYRKYAVVFFSCGYQLLELSRNEPFVSVASVVGHDIEILGISPELVLIHYQLFVLSAYYYVARHSHALSVLRLRINDGAAYSAADKKYLLELAKIRRVAKRPHHILDISAFGKRRHKLRRITYGLHEQRYRTLLFVGIAYRERHSFAVFVDSKYYKLPRLCMPRYVGRVNDVLLDIRSKLSYLQ